MNSVPKIIFSELTLGALATDIDSQAVGNLPYSGLPQLCNCLRELNRKPIKVTVRNVQDDVLFRTSQGGFYAGQERDLRDYPMLSLAQLETTHHEWWRSAQAATG